VATSSPHIPAEKLDIYYISSPVQRPSLEGMLERHEPQGREVPPCFKLISLTICRGKEGTGEYGSGRRRDR